MRIILRYEYGLIPAKNLTAEIRNFKHGNDFDPIKPFSDPIKPFSDPINERLYKEVRQDGKRNYAEFAELLGVSEATVKRRLNNLKKEGFIRRVGSNKTGYWEIIE